MHVPRQHSLRRRAVRSFRTSRSLAPRVPPKTVHLRQFRRYTVVGMSLLYLLVPLPIGLAWFRARFEKQAYAETIRAAAEVWGKSYASGPGLRAHVIQQFVGSAYGWMWPFRAHMERWYDQILATIEDNR